ncbi:PAS domain S-box protein [Synechocystis salina]|uniref:histidine kinase n=1 Tax=Synechocystis salina LEGE 00031 TaxID=1828736 RepID=A0ABR9VTH7_9SYNC|nr:PAS domain S-box protein [Synechocystis salina]MBE9242059.1 PAS domain S-box protein [Synechocystis salina LEGE 00041]MBE9254649.1 PAS domain S-box protein [Synechocystis salina LEGE 00031]
MGKFLIPIEFVFLAIAIACYLWYRQNQQRRKIEISLKQQTQRERFINQITQHIRQSLNLETVLNTTVAEVKTLLHVDRVLIYRIWQDGTGSAITESVNANYPSILGRTFSDEVFPVEYHQAYTKGKVRAINNIDQDDVEVCLADFVKQFGVQSKLVVPILQHDRSSSLGNESEFPYLWGLLIAHQCAFIRPWQPWEVELMKQLANQVAIAIQQSELYEQLQQLNKDLENRVEKRTQQLAATNQSLRVEISERQKTEAALRHTNHTLQSLIVASPRGIFTLNLADQIQIWNPAAERIFGWAEAEIIAHPELLTSDILVEDYQQFKQEILLGIASPSLELKCQKKDGSWIEIVLSAAPLLDSEENIAGLVAVVTDITEQKRQAEQIRLLQSVVVHTNDAVVITEAEPIDDPGPRILYVNEAFTKITGYAAEEMLGKTPRVLQGPKTSRTELDKVRQAVSQWQSITVEVINYRKDGSEFWVEFSLVPVADKTGFYTHWIAVQRDVTERRRTEEVRLALEREKELSRLKTRFFSMASHEFRTPLSTALAAAQLLENSEVAWLDPDKRSRNLHRIQNSVKNMVQLLDDILIINRAEAGKLEFNPSWLDLKSLFQQFIEEIQLSVSDQYYFDFICGDQDTKALVDERLMRSILSNLLSNAIKYSPDGGQIKISLSLDSENIIFEVTDQGIGISSEDQKQIFEPFHRGKNVRNIAGTGLGLMVAKKCVDLHRGSILLESAVDQGTTVTIRLQRYNRLPRA